MKTSDRWAWVVTRDPRFWDDGIYGVFDTKGMAEDFCNREGIKREAIMRVPLNPWNKEQDNRS